MAALAGVALDGARQLERLETQRERLAEENKVLRGQLAASVGFDSHEQTRIANAIKEWRGALDRATVAFRVASRGHTLMHDLKLEGIPDNPLTMMVVDADRLLLTHYCDADNRPRMVGKASPDGKTVEFDFLDISGNVQHGHMHHAVITFVDESHHTEDWTFMMPGDNSVRAHFDLQRTPARSAVSGK